MKPNRIVTFLLLSIINIMIVDSIYAESVDEVNHAPYSLSRYIELGTYKGNRFEYTLKGSDPDGDDIYFVLNNTTDLAISGINCGIFHANQLVCSVDENIHIEPSEICTLKDNYQLNGCVERTIKYHINDDRGKYSKNYSIKLYITSPDENITINDPTANPRGFFYEMEEATDSNEFGIATYSNNVAINLMNTDIFNDTNSVFKKELDVADEAIESNSPDALTTETLLDSTSGMNAMEGSAGGTSQEDMNDVIEASINSVSYEAINAPIQCVIERNSIGLQTYYVCNMDPMISVNPSLATKYYATNQSSEVDALLSCQENCRESSQCDEKLDIDVVDFARDKNFLDDSTYAIAENNAKKVEKINKIQIFEKDSSGKILNSYETVLSESINSSEITWNDDNIPSSKIISPNFELHTEFLSNTDFSHSFVGNTFILKPKIGYWAKISGRDIFRSYNGDVLYTVIFSSNTTKYQCPIPALSETLYENATACSNACVLQQDCQMFTDASYSAEVKTEIKNFCKDVTVSLGGVVTSLESATENGTCNLKDEYVVDNNGEVKKYYVRDYIQIDPYRPDIGFTDDSTILYKEKAAEIAYAFSDMLQNGPSQDRIDSTPNFKEKSFKDFDFKDSNEMFKVLPVVEGTDSANMDISLIVKLNPTYFEKNKAIYANREDLTTDTERAIYDAYVDVLDRKPEVSGLEYWTSRLAGEDSEAIKKAIYEGSLSHDSNVGITIGLLRVDIPDIIDENTTVHTNFMILDDKKVFRSVSITGTSVPLDENNATQVMVYTEYLKVLGREPDVQGYQDWLNYIRVHNLNFEQFEELFLQTAANNAENGGENYLFDFQEPTESSSLNNMLVNFSYAKNGVFNSDTASFVTAENPIYNPISKMIINTYVYERELQDHFMFLKAYLFDESLMGRPLLITSATATSPISSNLSTHYYLFAYVDKAPNMRHLKVKDFMDVVWEDFRDGTKKYFVWDYRDKSNAVKKIDETTVDWKNSYENNYFAKYFTTNSFSFLGDTNLVSAFYEDISTNRVDNVYVAKRGDNYIVKMNASGEKLVYSGSACPEDKPYDLMNKICISPDDGSTLEPSCPTGDYIDAAGKCYHIDQSLVNAFNRNGYYFLYLEKEGDPNLKFITPIVNSLPISCKRKTIRCNSTRKIYYSEDSCNKYCKDPTTNCENLNKEYELNVSPYYNLETCSENCYKTETTALDNVSFTLVAKGDILNKIGGISIKKYTFWDYSWDYTDQIFETAGNIYLGEDNSGISLGSLNRGTEIVIRYSTIQENDHYLIGLGRANEDMLNSPQTFMGWVPSDELSSCANMHAYYPNMGLYIDVDYNGDGVADKSIKISDTFVCHPLTTSLIIQRIHFYGDIISYDYVTQDGTIVPMSTHIDIKNFGYCNTGSENMDKIPLAQTYLTSEYISDFTQLEATVEEETVKGTMKFARKPFESEIGTVSRNVSSYYNYYENREDLDAVYQEINVNKNIPIPLFQGVYTDDDFDTILENTGLDYSLNSNLSGYKLKAGFGFVPWNDCRSFIGTNIATSYEYSSKTNCSSFGLTYIYSAYENKCIGAPIIDNSGNYTCMHGILNSNNKCEIEAECFQGYLPDNSDNTRCYKSVINTSDGWIKVCKPWWRIMRVYQCNNIDNVYNMVNDITAGPPRIIEVCKEKTRIYKSLAIDANGNIVEAE